MSEAHVAKRYAEALIEVGRETGKVNVFAHQLWVVDEALNAHGGMLSAVMASPVFTVQERDDVLTQVLPRLQLDPFMANFVRVMNTNGRLAAFTAVREKFNALNDVLAGRVRAQVVTAEPLTPQLEIEIKATLEAATGKTVLIQHSIDPSLIGGMIARVGGTIYDSSLRTRLSQLKQSLVSTQA